MDEDNCFDNINVLEASSTPMDWALTLLHEIMAEIIVECTTSVSVKLCKHVTSLFWGVGSNIHHLCLVWVNISMNSGMVFCWVDDGFENSINWMKDWHKTMMEHLDTHKKKTRE
jgi:hypothetical protein